MRLFLSETYDQKDRNLPESIFSTWDIEKKWIFIHQQRRLDNAEAQEDKAVFLVAQLRDDPSYVC
jgi:hypothetical protein